MSPVTSTDVDDERPLHALFIGRETHGCRLRLHETWSRLSVAPSHSPSKMSTSIVWVSGIMPSVESSISHEALLRLARFALAPRGNGGSSFRITEAVKAGAIPIYIWGGADQIMPALPFRQRIDWSLAAIVLEDHEQLLTHLIIDCYSREILSQMRTYLKDVSHFFSVRGFLNAMMDDIHESFNDTVNTSNYQKIFRRFEHMHHPPSWILGVSAGLTRFDACTSERVCSVSSSNAVVAALYLSFFKMFQTDDSQILRLSFFNHFIQSHKSSCLFNFNMLQTSSTVSFLDCPFLFLSPDISHSEARELFCNEASHIVLTTFGSVDNIFDLLTSSNLVRAIRIFRSCKYDSLHASTIYSHLFQRLQTACDVSSHEFKCNNFLSQVLNSEHRTAKFLHDFFEERSVSIKHQVDESQSFCRTLQIYSSVPSAFLERCTFVAFLVTLQNDLKIKILNPNVQLPSTFSLNPHCDSDSKYEAPACVLVAFSAHTLHLYDIFQPHLWRPSELNLNERDSMFHSSRDLWFALNSSCSAIDVVDASAVSKQNIIGMFRALVALLSLNERINRVFTDELPVPHWDFLSVTDSHLKFAHHMSSFASQFKHTLSMSIDPHFSSHFNDAQSALSSAVGTWPPCIIAYLPFEPCLNVTCLHSLVALAKDCSTICHDTSMVIIGDAASSLSDEILGSLQQALESTISRMFYIDNDDVFEEHEDAISIHMVSSSSCGLVSTHSSPIGTQAVLTR